MQVSVRWNPKKLPNEVAPNIIRLELPVPSPLPQTFSYIIRGVKGEKAPAQPTGTPLSHRDPHRSLIVDTGCNLPETAEAFKWALAALNLAPEECDVFLTHSDFDHVAGLSQIWRPGMTVYSGMDSWSQRAVPVMAGEGLREAEQIISENHDCTLDDTAEDWKIMTDRGSDDIPILTVHEEEVVHVGSRALRLLHTPGHCPFHLCLHDAGDRILFSGDHLMQDSYAGVTLGSDNDEMGDFYDSLHKIEPLDCRLFLPGHGGPGTDLPGRVQATIAHHDRQYDMIREVLSRQIAENGKPDSLEAVYATCTMPRRRTWEERNAFGRRALVGQSMGYLKHLITVGEFPEMPLYRRSRNSAV